MFQVGISWSLKRRYRFSEHVDCKIQVMDGLAEHTENRYLECLEEPRRISLGLPGRQGDICGLLGGPLLGTVSSHRV